MLTRDKNWLFLVRQVIPIYLTKLMRRNMTDVFGTKSYWSTPNKPYWNWKGHFKVSPIFGHPAYIRTTFFIQVRDSMTDAESWRQERIVYCLHLLQVLNAHHSNSTGIFTSVFTDQTKNKQDKRLVNVGKKMLKTSWMNFALNRIISKCARMSPSFNFWSR